MIFDEAHFITALLSTRLRMQDICGGACGEASCDERRPSSLSGRTMWRSLRLAMGLFRHRASLFATASRITSGAE